MSRTAALRIACLSTFALIAAAGVVGQESYLVNNTGTLLYLDFDGGSTDSPNYRQVPIAGVLPYEASRDITGFAYIRGSFQLPSLTLSASEIAGMMVESDTGSRFATIDNEMLDSETAVSPDSVAAAISGVRIDNHYLDWVGLGVRFARNRGAAPLGAYADFGSGREAIGRADALLWQRAGIDLEWIKAVPGSSDLYIAMSAYSAFGSDTSVFVYVYSPNRAVPLATIELPAGATRGLVFMWIPGEITPIVAGNLTVSEYFLEAQLWKEPLEAAGVTGGTGLSLEIATGSSAAGVWEEYVLARVSYEELFEE
jgi:hypothetical protein